MADLIEEDALGSAGASPASDFTVAAVDVHLHLGEEDGKHSAPDSGDQEASGDAPPSQDHQTGDAVGADSGAHEQHREVDRDVPEVELRGPVLRVLAAADFDRLCLGPKLRQRRMFRRGLFGHVRSSLIHGWYPATIARSPRRFGQDLPSSVLIRVVEISGVRGGRRPRTCL